MIESCISSLLPLLCPRLTPCGTSRPLALPHLPHYILTRKYAPDRVRKTPVTNIIEDAASTFQNFVTSTTMRTVRSKPGFVTVRRTRFGPHLPPQRKYRTHSARSRRAARKGKLHTAKVVTRSYIHTTFDLQTSDAKVRSRVRNTPYTNDSHFFRAQYR